MMYKPQPTKLSLLNHGITVSVEFETSDVNLTEMFNAFKALLIGATWNADQIDEHIIEMGIELQSSKKYDNE